MPHFTIITVCLNIVSTIERTLKSIANQTFQDFQWIVVDGASTDGTLDILKKYSNRIDILISEPDKGIYNAMNKGIKLATGKYINFMNGGDEFYDYSVLEKVFNSNMSADVVYGDISWVYDNETIIHTNHKNLSRKSIYWQTISHQASFCNTKLLQRFGFDEKFNIAADYDFFVKLYSKKYIFQRKEIIIANYFMDGLSTICPDEVLIEYKQIRKNYFSCLERYFIEHNTMHFMKVKLNFFAMVITHPRFIAGWIKRKIIKNYDK